MIENVFLIAMIRVTSIITLLNIMFLTTKDHNTSIHHDLTCIHLFNFYNQNMFKQLEHFWL